MKYDNARAQIKSGDLLAWSHRGWSSWYDIKVQAVRIWQRSRYSHVATAYVGMNRVWVIEAVMPEIRMIPLSNALPFDWVAMGAPWKPETEERMIGLIGRPKDKAARYSQWQAVMGGMGKLKPGTDNLWMCAETAWYAAKLDGIDLGSKIYPSEIVQSAALRPEGRIIPVEA